MKKKIFSVVAAVAVVATASWSYQQNKQSEGLSELALANAEALAGGEASGDCKWRTGWSSSRGWITICDTHGVNYICEFGSYNISTYFI